MSTKTNNIKNKDTIIERLIQLRRTSTKRTGGPLFHYSALCVAGDGKGNIGIATAKSKENVKAINKAKEKAKKNMVRINLTENKSIPHDIYIKKGASKILIKPAPVGSGIIAGGSIRDILELAGIKNISVKVIGTNNPIMNAYTLLEALKKLKFVNKK